MNVREFKQGLNRSHHLHQTEGWVHAKCDLGEP